MRKKQGESQPHRTMHSVHFNNPQPSILNQSATNNNQKTQPSKSKPETSPVSAVPASILKKDKPGLLSQEQKRANHIASEQKRRAAIRQGYSRLCMIVPSLRVRQQEQQSTISRQSEDDSPTLVEQDLNSPAIGREDNNSVAASKRKRNKSATQDLQLNQSGARSEAVVLAKTVEYLRELEGDRKGYLENLNRLKSIARSKGISLRSAPRGARRSSIKENLTEAGEARYQPALKVEMGEEEEEEEQEEIPIWESKWTGNIQEIDRQYNTLDPSHKTDHHSHHMIDTSPTTPAQFDLAQFHPDHPDHHHHHHHPPHTQFIPHPINPQHLLLHQHHHQQQVYHHLNHNQIILP
ncbi:hypothetical protein Pst134EA_027699 [Puccinia striiformis f. sp. tritici]|uniref:hypothetical protein n=1 Tax=Puccinia striiformis f. sp. tritici TaxID=168172 RepID=UPI0020076A62|nr:hypothetical protein Pst134EA_027699 [Puccinia striiformis f. sp. tritici]KAH9448387.1 hypothetical protein Pst134EA_027699 [Puccinia striiformis f. sp. tritici]